MAHHAATGPAQPAAAKIDFKVVVLDPDTKALLRQVALRNVVLFNALGCLTQGALLVVLDSLGLLNPRCSHQGYNIL